METVSVLFSDDIRFPESESYIRDDSAVLTACFKAVSSNTLVSAIGKPEPLPSLNFMSAPFAFGLILLYLRIKYFRLAHKI